MKNTILIIGAGQIGSRHLQGVLKIKEQLDVIVMDASSASLALAREKAAEIANNHNVLYIDDLQTISQKVIKVAIIATNSDVREQVIHSLLENCVVEYLILEKVLFNKIASYYNVKQLLEKHKVKCWVNHSRRMFESYKQIKQNLSSGTPKVYQMIGSNWGLGCNGLHFIDLFAYLSSSKLVSLNTDLIDNMLIPSKRAGFIEFSGTLNGCFEDHSVFQITSLNSNEVNGTIIVCDKKQRIVIQETGVQKIYKISQENNFMLETYEFQVEFQSNLTTLLIDRLIQTDTCELPIYNDACSLHIPFVTQLLKLYNQLVNDNNIILPIT